MDDTQTADTPRPGPAARRLVLPLAALALTALSALGGTALARWLRAESDERPAGAAAARFPDKLFEGWSKPDLVLLLSGQQNGYVLPCGCSRPQVGGLERRYNLVQMVKAAGWPYVAVDLGDVPQRHGVAGLPNQQAMIKYVYSMKALKAMDYAAVTVGESEANLGLLDVLAEYALQFPSPRVVAGNLIDAEKNYPEMTRPWHLAEPVRPGVKVGVTGVVGTTVAMRIGKLTASNNPVKFEKTPDALDRVLGDMQAQKVDLPVLLYQGPIRRPGSGDRDPPTEAAACAGAYPQFPVVVCTSDDDHAPVRPYEVINKAGGRSLVVALGQKGKFVGVLGVWKTGKAEAPFRFQYQRVELTESFLTPEGKEKENPVLGLMELYTKDLKDQNYLEKYGRQSHPLQVMAEVAGLRRPVKPEDVKYVGSEKCKRCHEAAYEIWKEKTPHSHAYKTLVEAKRPSNRQYDPECIVCHTVGFGQKSGFVTEAATPDLKNVGCESCHGPGGAHVLNPENVEWQKRMNPWKELPAGKREAAIDQFCQRCHDIDNDVTWVNGGFKRKWPKIDHPTPKPKD